MSRLQTITSVSGGKTSAYLAANYPCDDLVFSLVRIEDKNCLFSDKKIRQLVEDRIQASFVASTKDDTWYTATRLQQKSNKTATSSYNLLKLQIITSVWNGKTSAHLVANYSCNDSIFYKNN